VYKKKIVVIWSEGFPYKFSASNEKNKLLALAFANETTEVLIISKGFPPANKDAEGKFESVPFKFMMYKKQNFVRLLLISTTREIKMLSKLKREHTKVILLASYTPIIYYAIFGLFAKILKYKLVLNIMEWHIAQHEKSSLVKKINPYLFDKFAFRFSSAAITISDYIESKLRSQKKISAIVKIPAITDLEIIQGLQFKSLNLKPYLLYCGNIGYKEVIDMLIDAYTYYLLNHSNSTLAFKLVLNGSKNQIEQLRKKIRLKKLENHIEILQSLEYELLISYYKNAAILLIPLRNSDQDAARYPQKIAEYAACGRPIISNRIGQVGIDFTHKKDIYFAESFNSIEYEKVIKNLLNNENLATNLGRNVTVLSQNLFDFRLYHLPLSKLILEL
jgi:glycosyltransferase involved in cell wall biosynthesis